MLQGDWESKYAVRKHPKEKGENKKAMREHAFCSGDKSPMSDFGIHFSLHSYL